MSKKFIRTPEEWHQYDLDLVESYRPMDDDFMRELFRDNLPLAQKVLRIITGIHDLELTHEESQFDLKKLLGLRSICLDVFGRDSKGQVYDLEIQRNDQGAAPQRARYHSSALDVEFLRAKGKFQTLPISYVIFITENDVLGEGELIYEVDRTIKKSGTIFKDDAHIIFINGAYNNPDDTSDLAKLVHDFRCTNADDMYIKELADKTREYKETEKGVSMMCEKIENMRKEAAREAEIVTRIVTLIELVRDGDLTIEKAAKKADMTVPEFEDWMEQYA